MAPDSIADDRQSIRRVLEDRARALHDRDADAAIGFLSENLVAFGLHEPLRLVGPSARDPERLKAWFEHWDGEIDIEFRELAVTVAADFAYCHGLQRLQGFAASGLSVTRWTRMTVCLRRIDDGWRIVHEHHSVPISSEDGERAALTLRP